MVNKLLLNCLPIDSHHELVIAFAEVTIKAAMTAQQHREAYHHRLYGDCCGVDSRDDYGDVVAHLVPAGRVTSCTFDLVSTYRHLTNVAMTSASCDLNCETKDFVKIR